MGLAILVMICWLVLYIHYSYEKLAVVSSILMSQEDVLIAASAV